MKGAGEPGGWIRGRRRGGVPPLNSLKCVGERGKDESFSSQRRDPAKGRRGRAAACSAPCEPEGSAKASSAAGPAGSFPLGFLAKRLPEPPGVVKGSANAARPAGGMRGCGQGREPMRGQGAGGCGCWVGTLSLAEIYLWEDGQGTPAPGGCFRQGEQPGRGCGGMAMGPASQLSPSR